MKYRAFIEEYFSIDDPKTGELVPFKFNDVQNKYYDTLQAEYQIEERGISEPIRDDILKARREGFSSFVLALFAADDILQTNPTITQVISYKDDATKVFRNRYKNYILSYYAKKLGIKVNEVKEKDVFDSVEGGEYVLRENGAKFICGTASARTGERGGVLQKLLFSEAAFYPDTENMTAKEIIEGTLRQVDIASGWVFIESTANGKGNYYQRLWELATTDRSRFKPRFYGWRESYTEEEFKIISEEFADKDMLKQEYPETAEEAFLASGLNFTNADDMKALIGAETGKELVHWLELKGTNYIDQCEIIKNELLELEKDERYNGLYVGIDVAKDKDSTVMTVLRDEKQSVQGGVKAICIDSTGIGDFMPDWMELNTRWYIERIKFSRQKKDVMYKNLQAVIKNKLTSIPEIMDGTKYVSKHTDRFWNEMMDLQKKVLGNLLVVSHPNGADFHDDYPDSWALAELAYVILNPIKGEQKVETDTKTNAIESMLNRATSGQKDNYVVTRFD